MATDTEKIIVQIKVVGQKDLQNLDTKTKKVTKSAGSLTAEFSKLTGGILAASTAFRQISKIISSAVKTFTKFEFEMAKVRAITGSTDKDFKKLTVTAQQLGRTTFFTASQVAELQVNFGKLGFSTQEILNAQEATLLLATATQSDLGRAAIVAGAAVRGFALDASETQRVVDVMAVAFTSSALDIEKFQTSMTKVSPIAAAANITLESTTAIMGTLTDAGIEASIAGTSLRNIFLKMQDPASDLSQKLGFTVNSSADLEKALQQLNSEGLSNAEMMELVDLRQVAAFATMVNGTDRILDLTDAFEDSTDAAKDMADIMADTLQGDILKAKSAYEGFEIAILKGNNNISRTLRGLTSSWTEFLNTVVDNWRSTGDIAQDFVKDALDNVKDIQKEIDELQKSGAPVETKERSELLQIEIESRERTLKAIKATLPALEKEAQKTSLSGAAARTMLENQIQKYDAIVIAIKDLEEIKDLEIRSEKQREDRISLDKDIQDAKNKRAKDKKDKEELAEEEKKEKAKLKIQQDNFKAAQQEFKIALEEEINAEKENLLNKVITQEEFDNRIFEAEQAHLENMKNLNIAYGEDVSAINGAILDLELNRIQTIAEAEKAAFDKKLKEEEKEKKDRKDKIGEMKDIGNQLIFIAGEEENLQGVKKAGIAISRAAAIATSFEAMADYGKAIADAAADSPWYLKIINVVGLIASMASTLSLIKSMKSGFGDGGIIDTFADGGMVHGKSHAQGGEKFAVGGRVVELEGGEAVINKRSTSMFRGQLSAMNAAGGGVKFADGGLMNMPSFAQSQFSATSQAGMMGAIGQGGRVVVVESDISTVQNTVSVIEAEATI